MNKRAVFLNDIGIANPLGVGKAQVAENLFKGSQSGMVRRDDLCPNEAFYVGQTEADLPEIPASGHLYNTRNNRLMAACFEGDRPSDPGRISQFGPDRVAVVLGTSTSGLSDAEPALLQKALKGNLPSGYDFKYQECGAISEFVAWHYGLTGPGADDLYCLHLQCQDLRSGCTLHSRGSLRRGNRWRGRYSLPIDLERFPRAQLAVAWDMQPFQCQPGWHQYRRRSGGVPVVRKRK